MVWKDVICVLVLYLIFSAKLYFCVRCCNIKWLLSYFMDERTDLQTVWFIETAVYKRKIFILYFAQSNLWIFIRVWQFVVVFALLKPVCKKIQIWIFAPFCRLRRVVFSLNHRGSSFCLLEGEIPEMFCIKSAKSFQTL